MSQDIKRADSVAHPESAIEGRDVAQETEGQAEGQFGNRVGVATGAVWGMSKMSKTTDLWY